MMTDSLAVEKLRQLKNELGTYQAVANRLYETSGVELSPALIWQVMEKGSHSPKVQKALGLYRKRYRRSAEFASQKEVEIFDEVMCQMDLSLTKLCSLIIEGKVQIKKNNNNFN